ncbi:MAG: DUF924 domain-containing protein [Pseudomonadota bacterium]|nr:DUF924 domain-containing protein [Pseudomonadota bacterium]
MDSTPQKPEDVLSFWFDEVTPGQWWAKSEDFDRCIETRFGELFCSATRCELYKWRESVKGRLAEIIVLDQFSRNIHRDSPESFTHDPLALALAQMAVADKIDQELDPAHRAFLYMPYMHSESSRIHEVALILFSLPGLESNLDFELRHKEIIDRFGRYPHRNAILGRVSTTEETEFLKMSGSSF